MFESNLKGEGGSILLKAGWNLHRVIDITYGEAKSTGNPMYTLTLEEPITGSIDIVYMVDVKSKRWMLKQFLTACNLQEDTQGDLKWTEEDVIGCSIEACNVPEKNSYINRDNETITEMRNKLQGIRKSQIKATI